MAKKTVSNRNEWDTEDILVQQFEKKALLKHVWATC